MSLSTLINGILNPLKPFSLIAGIIALIGTLPISANTLEDFGPVKNAVVNVDRSNVPAYYLHGTIVAEFKNKKSVALNSAGNGMDLKIFPDRRTIGWIEGEMSTYRNDPWFYPKTVVIWKDGKILRKITPGMFLTGWGIVANGKQIATAAAGMHGPTYMKLYDLNSGKILDTAKNYDKKHKAWVKSIPETNGPLYN